MKELLVEAILHQQYYIDVDAFDWGFNETTNIAEVHLSWKVFYWKAGAAAEWERKRGEKQWLKRVIFLVVGWHYNNVILHIANTGHNIMLQASQPD